MQEKNIFRIMIAAGIFLVAVTAWWLAAAAPANAQCGSQASSCKSCHEVQGQKPVSSDSTAWHTSHAFGDFCYICHAGNNQAPDQTQAHQGMAPPLSDIKASCQQCHPGDLQERAQVYASALGVEIGAASAPANTSVAAAPAQAAAAAVAAAAPTPAEINLDDPNLVDYAAHYNEIVLGKKPVNWGNLILVGLIGLVAIGGGGYVITREKLVKVSYGNTQKAGDEYPAEVVEMLPALAGLKSTSRKSLKKVIENPKKAEKVLQLMEAVTSDTQNEESQ